jgi:hypothetical protein
LPKLISYEVRFNDNRNSLGAATIVTADVLDVSNDQMFSVIADDKSFGAYTVMLQQV